MPAEKALNQSCILTPAIATRIASVFPKRKDFVRMFHAHRGFGKSTIFQEKNREWTHREERPFLLGVIEGILFSSQKREYPLTSTNFEAKLHFKCRLCRQKKPWTCKGLEKFWTQNDSQMQACLQNVS